MKRLLPLLALLCFLPGTIAAQTTVEEYFSPVKYRSIGPFRGGRSVAAQGLPHDPLTAYMGITGGGVWKTADAGQHWENISDGFFKTGSVGALTVAPNDDNVIYVGMGEHAPRGVMSSHGDGVYKSTDAGKNWQHLGLTKTRQIAGIIVHPDDSDYLYVAAQGAYTGASPQRGVYRSKDGGQNWEKVLYVDENTGCSHLIMDPNNPRILYAAMWDHRRYPWQVRSGGPGSGLYKSTDGGSNWEKLEKGLPEGLGKMSLSISADNSEKIYALIESDSNKEKGGLFVSTNAGENWTHVSKDHRLVQRAWYYIEVFADPQDENTVYVLNSSVYKSIDGGKNWSRIGGGTHGDHHHLWINPTNSRHLVLANDGGAAISFNGGKSWSTQANMPTAQFYRINVDNHFPYRIYAGQQDNSSVRIEHRNISGGSISTDNWTRSAGGESAFLAFDPDNPRIVLGGSYQGTIVALDSETQEARRIMAAPQQFLARDAKDMPYRFNWNAPILWDRHAKNTFYHAGNKVLATTDLGKNWREVSPDLTRNEIEKQGKGGAPFTNEGAGGENYGTIAYLTDSPHAAGELWTGSDDGLVHLTRDGGKSWNNITPAGLEECLINAIEVSPHTAGTAYIATTRYKFNDLRPAIYRTTDYGKSWQKITTGIPNNTYVRVVREDPIRKGLLFAGTETGIYVSYDTGKQWEPFQRNLPITPITDLKIHQNDLIVATSGRSFWVLDDLEALRQYQPEATANRLLQPADVYRLSARGGMNSNQATGTASTTGVNPASGAVIYYELTEEQAKAGAKLQILAADGKVVRSFTSKSNPNFKSYAGGPSPEPVIDSKKGLNRFVWNLRHPTLRGAPKAYLEGSFAGRRVVPGVYTARLVSLKDSDESPTNLADAVSFQVLPHPDLDLPLSAYEAQDELMQEVSGRINEIHGAVNELAKLRKRIAERAKDLKQDKNVNEELRKSGKSLIKELKEWESELIQRKSEAYDDVINFPNKLSAEYLFLKGQMDTNTPNVTTPMQERLKELDAKWSPLKAKRTELESAIEAYEQALLTAGIKVLR